jgi:type IV fimbrial biogenesis protein FimT
MRALNKTAPRGQRGITLIELGVVAATMSVIALSVAPSFADSINRRRIEGVAAQFQTDVQYARAGAVTRGEPLRISFVSNAQGSGYVVHSGGAGDCTVLADGNPQCKDPAEPLKAVFVPLHDAVGLQTSVASMLFDPQHGTATPSATVKVIGMNGRAIHEMVNIMGRTRSCSPAPALPGQKAC